MARQPKHDCPCCTCGMTEIWWSDRRTEIFLDDHEAVADAVVSCALDHDYDRTKTGVPHGLSDQLRDQLAHIVDRHLSAKDPDWRSKSMHLESHEQTLLRDDLLAALREIS